MTAMRQSLHAAVLCSVILVSGCREVTVPNYNAASIDQLTRSPTSRIINGTVLGLFAGAREQATTMARQLGVLGREIVYLDATDRRSVTVWLQGPLSQAGAQFVDFGWNATYRQLRAGYAILDVVARVPDYTEEQREAVRGITKTFLAMALLDQLAIRDTFGLVIDIDLSNATLGDFVTRDVGYERAAALLDEAREHLGRGGAQFPFAMPAGFSNFNTPARLVRFNRAVKARLEAYRGRWSDVSAALAESFIATPGTGVRAALDSGVYHSYEGSNGLFDATPSIVATLPSFLTDAQHRANDSLDLRALAKAQATATCLSLEGVSSCIRVTRYASQTANVPIIRNEELILLRAEAALAAGNRAAAITDINYIRVNAGGLVPLPAAYAGDLLSEILYNRRYSLFYEYGHRWIDMRRYGRLSQLEKMLPGHHLFPLAPLPQQECLARGNTPKGCVTVDGI